jgi:hypothetical protein
MAKSSSSQRPLLVPVLVKVNANTTGLHPRQPPFNPNRGFARKGGGHQENCFFYQRARPTKIEPKGRLVRAPQALTAQTLHAGAQATKERAWDRFILDVDETHRSI